MTRTLPLLIAMLVSGAAIAAPESEPVAPAPTAQPASTTDASPAAPAVADTDVPAEASNDTTLDTDAPPAEPPPEPPAGPPTDTDEPEQIPESEPVRTWPGWDRFVGPSLPAEVLAAADTDTDERADTDASPAAESHPDTDTDTHAGAGVDDATEHHDVTHDAPAADADPDPDPDPPTARDSEPAPHPLLPRALPFLPSLPLRGWRIGVLLAMATALFWGVARLLGPVRDWLAPTGILPTLTSALQQVFRAVALFFAFGVIAAIIPANLEPALPWVVLAGAIALGWSAREVTPDFVAGVVLAAERRVRPGQWIGTAEMSGVVEQVTLRVTWVRDATGRRVAVPNRSFLRGAVITDRGQWPSVEVVLRIPGEHRPSTIRRIVEDAVLVSPWSAPLPPDLVREEQEAGLWRVRARVLEGRFADRFEGALREHVEEVLKTGTGLRVELGRRSDERDEPSDAPPSDQG